MATQRLLDSSELRERFEIIFLDLSDRRDPTNIGIFDWGNLWLGIRHSVECLGQLLLRRPAIVYLGVSQGLWGYLRDLAFMVPALLLGRQLVIHLRGSEFHVFYGEMPEWLRWVTRRVFGRAARVVVLGRRLRAVFEGLVKPERIVVIPNGIDCDKIAKPNDASSSQKTGKRVLFLSSLRERKGLFLFLEALPSIIHRHPDVQVTIAGTWQSAEEKQRTETMVRELDLAGHCTFVGEVSGDDKYRAYREHDLFVFPPVEPEGLPWVILEAMAASLPIVTTDQGAIAEVVENAETGYIIEPTVGNLADRINHLLDNPDLMRVMGGKGRRRVETQFSEHQYFRSLADLFGEVV